MDTKVRTRTITAVNNAAKSISILQVTTPADVDDGTFLAQFRQVKDSRQRAYDTSVRATLKAMCRKYKYALSETIPDVVIDESYASGWNV